MIIDTETVINCISKYLNKDDKIVAVYLFGSFAAGKNKAYSDIDVAVLIDESRLKEFDQEYQMHFNNLSRLTRKDIDLVVMNTLSESLLKQIYDKGKCILVKNHFKLSLFNMTAYAKIADFAYTQRIMQQGVIKSIFSESAGGQ